MYVMNADGADQRRLIALPGSGDGQPTWSADGTRIAFSSYEYSNGTYYIRAVDATDGGNLTTLITHGSDPDWHVRASPGSKSLVLMEL